MRNPWMHSDSLKCPSFHLPSGWSKVQHEPSYIPSRELSLSEFNHLSQLRAFGRAC